MNSQFPALIIVVPLIAALLVNIAGWLRKSLCFPVAVAALAASWLFSIGLLHQVLHRGIIAYRMGGWSPPWGIAYRVDHLGGIVLMLVLLVGLINVIATRGTAAQAFNDRLGAFYSLYLLFVTGLMGIIITGDAFNLYVLLEIASLTAYALIGMGGGRAPLSGLHYIFMGTIGASFYLLGIGYLYIVTGSLNMADLAVLLPSVERTSLVKMSFIFCMVGLFIKMAFFPLHGWLPNAYSHAPNPCASLIAPLTTKVMIYVMIRVIFSIYHPDFAFTTMRMGNPIVWLAVIAILAGSILAYRQDRLKRMLAYIIVVEVGYMVGGFWLGNRAGFTGAVLHILNDAMMTLCLFLAVGAIASRIDDDDFTRLQGIFRKMPFTMTAFVIGALSIIGVPPTGGFFSKWYMITGGLQAGHYAFAAALVTSSLVSALLFFRIFEIGYFGTFEKQDTDPHGMATAVQEAPLDMLIALAITAGVVILMGLYSYRLVSMFIDPVVPAAFMGGH